MSEDDLSAPVRYIVMGEKYEVPLGYHYHDYLKRKGRWPDPKDHFTNAGGISIIALIPGMRPYSMENKSEFEQLGFGNKINIQITPPTSLYPVKEWLRRMEGEGRLEQLPSDLAGLTRYWDNYAGTDTGQGADIYIKEEGVPYFKLHCPRRPGPSPACEITKEGANGLHIHYSFSKDHLASWKSIDKGIDRLIEQFAVQ